MARCARRLISLSFLLVLLSSSSSSSSLFAVVLFRRRSGNAITFDDGSSFAFPGLAFWDDFARPVAFFLFGGLGGFARSLAGSSSPESRSYLIPITLRPAKALSDLGKTKYWRKPPSSKPILPES